MLLSSCEDRWKGVVLLSTFQKCCDAETFYQNAGFWIKSLLQVLTTNVSFSLRNLVLHGIKYLLKKSTQFDELSRDFAGTVVQPLLQCLIKDENNLSGLELDVIEQCILSYPRPSGKFRTQIERLLVGLLDIDNEAVRVKVCQCFSVLAMCGSGGEKGTKYSDYWYSYLSMIMNSIHQFTNDLFGREASIRSQDLKLNIIKFKAIPSSEPDHSILISRRIRSLLCVLKDMLSYEFPCVVTLPIEHIMNTLYTVFNSNLQPSLQISVEQACIQAVLPAIVEEAVLVITVLIAQSGTLILPYAVSIMQIVNKVISNDQKSDQNLLQPVHVNFRLNTVCYQLLCMWLNIIHSFPPREDLLLRIVEAALKDIQVSSIKPSSNLSSDITSKTGKKAKKNKQKHFQNELSAREFSIKTTDNAVNSGTAFAALKFLESTLSNVGPVLPTTILSKIQAETISLAMKISEACTQYNQSFAAPYELKDCRLQLYRTIFALLNLYHYHLPSHVATLITLLQRGKGDASSDVSSFCHQCIAFADKIIRPSAPSFRTCSIAPVGENDKPSVSSSALVNFGSNSLTFSGIAISTAEKSKSKFRPSETETIDLVFKDDAVRKIESTHLEVYPGTKKDVLNSSDLDSVEIHTNEQNMSTGNTAEKPCARLVSNEEQPSNGFPEADASCEMLNKDVSLSTKNGNVKRGAESGDLISPKRARLSTNESIQSVKVVDQERENAKLYTVNEVEAEKRAPSTDLTLEIGADASIKKQTAMEEPSPTGVHKVVEKQDVTDGAHLLTSNVHEKSIEVSCDQEAVKGNGGSAVDADEEAKDILQSFVDAYPDSDD